MTGFEHGFRRNAQGGLTVSGVLLSPLLAEARVGTPAYVYDLDGIQAGAQALLPGAALVFGTVGGVDAGAFEARAGLVRRANGGLASARRRAHGGLARGGGDARRAE